MATHDYVIANASGAAVRSDLNNALAAIVSNNSNATEPATTYAYMWWADTGSTPPVLKIRNAANDAWITLFQLDGEFSTIALENGTAAAPSLYFKDSGTDTGLYSPGTDSVAITTGGTARATVDSSGRLLVNTSSGSGNPLLKIQGQVANANAGAILSLARGTTPPVAGNDLGEISFRQGTDEYIGATIAAESDAAWTAGSSYPSRLVFSTTASGAVSPTERLKIDKDGLLYSVPTYNNTTGSTTNYLRIGSDGQIYRSTSSIAYKTDVEDMDDAYADAILNLRPVWYRSTCEGDNPDHSHWGFIAEEVEQVDPRLCSFKDVEVTQDEAGNNVVTPLDTPVVDGVDYASLTPLLLNLIKRQKTQIEALETRITALEGAN